MNTEKVLLCETTHDVDELKLLPAALEQIGPLICSHNRPIPGLPCLRGHPDSVWINGRYAVKTPWGPAEALWGSDAKGLWSFTPLYRLLTPNDALPAPQIPQIGYAVWDTITGIVTVRTNKGDMEPVYLRPAFDGMDTKCEALFRIRTELAYQGIPIFPVRLYQADSLPYPWKSTHRAAKVTNREVSVSLAGYAVDEHQVVYLHIVGAKTAIRSVWATLQANNKRPLFIDDGDSSITAYPSGGSYVSYSAPVLADTGDYRMIILDRRAIDATGEDTAYLVMPCQGQETVDLNAAFAARLDSILPIPVLPEWGELLIEEGQKRHIAEKLNCGGDAAGGYAIVNGSHWVKMIENLLKQGKLKLEV